MNKCLIFFILTGFLTEVQAQESQSSVYFQPGTVMESLQMESKILDENVSYSIYLPPDYKTSDRRYPVVYLLHGYSDDETAWIQFGEVNQATDRGIASRDIPPMIIVMPDARVTFYVNDYQGKDRYEDMIFREFIPFIDATYRTRAKKEFRAVSGLSMGGFGSLVWALHHPDVFSVCVAYSAAVYSDDDILNLDQRRYESWYKSIFGPGEGEERITEHFRKNSPFHLMETLPVEEIEKVKFYIDCGDDDFLYRGNSLLHILMRDRGIDHEFRIREGAHNWTYWRTHIYTGLEYIGNTFHR